MSNCDTEKKLAQVQDQVCKIKNCNGAMFVSTNDEDDSTSKLDCIDALTRPDPVRVKTKPNIPISIISVWLVHDIAIHEVS